MDTTTTLAELSNTIGLSLAPMFLFMGIAAFLSMLSLRLGRVIDRGRLLDSRIGQVAPPAKKDRPREVEYNALCQEAALIWRRIFYMNWSIRCAVCSALLVCLVVVCLFLTAFVAADLSTVISGLFILAMTLLVVSLVFLLFEVGVSTRKLRQGLEHLVTR